MSRFSIQTCRLIPFINLQVLKLILQGILLSPVESCPPPIREVMKKCWSSDPGDRPTFHEIHKTLENIQQTYNFKYEQSQKGVISQVSQNSFLFDEQDLEGGFDETVPNRFVVGEQNIHNGFEFVRHGEQQAQCHNSLPQTTESNADVNVKQHAPWILSTGCQNFPEPSQSLTNNDLNFTVYTSGRDLYNPSDSVTTNSSLRGYPESEGTQISILPQFDDTDVGNSSFCRMDGCCENVADIKLHESLGYTVPRAPCIHLVERGCFDDPRSCSSTCVEQSTFQPQAKCVEKHQRNHFSTDNENSKTSCEQYQMGNPYQNTPCPKTKNSPAYFSSEDQRGIKPSFMSQSSGATLNLASNDRSSFRPSVGHCAESNAVSEKHLLGARNRYSKIGHGSEGVNTDVKYSEIYLKDYRNSNLFDADLYLKPIGEN